jgi:hypothetical protein
VPGCGGRRARLSGDTVPSEILPVEVVDPSTAAPGTCPTRSARCRTGPTMSSRGPLWHVYQIRTNSHRTKFYCNAQSSWLFLRHLKRLRRGAQIMSAIWAVRNSNGDLLESLPAIRPWRLDARSFPTATTPFARLRVLPECSTALSRRFQRERWRSSASSDVTRTMQGPASRPADQPTSSPCPRGPRRGP